MPPKRFNPVPLLALAVIAAAVGAAWYVVDRRQPVDEEALDELETALLANSLDLQDQLTGDIDARQLADEKARAESDEGIKLAALCNAWIEFDSNHPDESTRANLERACDDYRRFIETGELPERASD